MTTIGSNSGLTEETFARHLATISRAEADLELARKAKNTARKRAKADGIVLKDFDAMRRLADLTRSEQIEVINNQALYLRFLRVPIGSQLTLFGDDDGMSAIETETEGMACAQAHSRGFLDGVSGKADENPFAGNTAVGLEWQRGFNEGRALYDTAPLPLGDDDDEGDE